MKMVIDRLRRGGGAVVVVPEGTRTSDGRLGEFKSGFALIAKRAAAPIVPVAIVGAYECWPRTRLFPRPGRIRLEFGRLVTAAEVAALDERELFAVCNERIRAADAAARDARTGVRAPAPAPA
jgi:1-acyl-sn-glycerol-3-phosphate acyltransferase